MKQDIILTTAEHFYGFFQDGFLFMTALQLGLVGGFGELTLV